MEYFQFDEQLRYKYIVSADGHTAAWLRIFTILQSNSVMLWINTAKYQWFYDRLEPWVHYVPLKRDLSDLEEKISWLRANDDKARGIAEQATLFAKNYLKEHHTREWTLRNLKLYEKAYHQPTVLNSTYEAVSYTHLTLPTILRV